MIGTIHAYFSTLRPNMQVSEPNETLPPSAARTDTSIFYHMQLPSNIEELVTSLDLSIVVHSGPYLKANSLSLEIPFLKALRDSRPAKGTKCPEGAAHTGAAWARTEFWVKWYFDFHKQLERDEMEMEPESQSSLPQVKPLFRGQSSW